MLDVTRLIHWRLTLTKLNSTWRSLMSSDQERHMAYMRRKMVEMCQDCYGTHYTEAEKLKCAQAQQQLDALPPPLR
ncbi:MAG: hypothetical protein ACK5PR_00965, partial [bacterium]